MDDTYTAAIPVPQGAAAWDDLGPYEEGAERGGMAEKVYVLLLVAAGALGFFIYREGYLYLAVGMVGLPFILAWLVEPRIGIYAYCFWQAWDAAIAFGENDMMTPAKLLAFGVLSICLLHVWRHPFKIRACRAVFGWACVLCAISLASSLWSYDTYYSLRYGLQMLVQLLLALLMVVMICERTAYVKRLAFWTLLGGVTAAAWIFLYGREVSRFERASLSGAANPVSAAAGLGVAIGCAPLLWFLIRRRISKVLLIAASLLIVVAIVETGTRAVLGGVVGGFAGAAVLVRGSGRAKRVAFITAGLAVAYMIGAMIVYSNLIMDQTATRLAEFMQLPLPNATSRFAGHSGTREYVWTLAMEGFQKSGVMGSGIGTSAWASGKATGHFKDVHSNLLGALVEIGPLGLLVFLGLHVALTLRIPRIQDHWLQVPAWMILLSTFAVGLVHTTYTAKYFWLPITFLAIIYEMDARKSAAEDPLGEFAPQV